MALPVWQATVTDDTGDVLPGAQIDVVIESTGTDATLFSNRAGTTSLSNPFFADSEGFAQFYTDAGAYRITATASGGGTTRTWRYVSLFDFDANVGTAAGEVPLNSDLGSASLVDAIGSGDLYGRDSILGTVSETAGVPTGAVIESGSNSDGEYIKYANGTQICTHYALASGDVNNAIGNVYNTGSLEWTFPAEFVSPPAVSVTEATLVGNCWGGLGTGSTTSTSTTYNIFRATAVPTTPMAALIAIGSWF